MKSVCSTFVCDSAIVVTGTSLAIDSAATKAGNNTKTSNQGEFAFAGVSDWETLREHADVEPQVSLHELCDGTQKIDVFPHHRLS